MYLGLLYYYHCRRVTDCTSVLIVKIPNLFEQFVIYTNNVCSCKFFSFESS